MALDIKITGLEDCYDDATWEYFNDLAETLKFTYSRAYETIRDYHYKKLDFTLVVKANLEGRCFDYVIAEGDDFNQHKHDDAMLVNDVNIFFKAV